MITDTPARQSKKKVDENDTVLKTCPSCGEQWKDREQLLHDPTLKLVGYQVNFKRLQAGIMLFNHSCRTTLALQVEVFADLYDGPIFSQCATGTAACGGHCLHEGDLRPCPAECECAFVRHIIQVIKAWPKKDAGG